MNIYYSSWKGNEKKFDEPIVYDYSFTVRFPNVVLMAKDIREAKEKIETINSRIEKMDRFELNQSKIFKLAFM